MCRTRRGCKLECQTTVSVWLQQTLVFFYFFNALIALKSCPVAMISDGLSPQLDISDFTGLGDIVDERVRLPQAVPPTLKMSPFSAEDTADAQGGDTPPTLLSLVTEFPIHKGVIVQPWPYITIGTWSPYLILNFSLDKKVGPTDK